MNGVYTRVGGFVAIVAVVVGVRVSPASPHRSDTPFPSDAPVVSAAPQSPLQQSTETETERLFPVTVAGRQGMIDAYGRMVIQPSYDMLWGLSEGLASVWVDKKWGYINTKGDIVIKPRFQYARGFSDGLAAVQTENGWTFIDRTGEPITGEVFDGVGQFSDGVAPVEVAGVWGYINRTGAIVIAPQYRLAWSFSHGRAIVYPADDLRCQLIDNTGLVLLQAHGQDCRGGSDGPIAVRAAGYGAKYGYITAAGAPLTSFIFDWAEAFHEGLAAVRIDGHTGFIDLTGRMAISAQFDADEHNLCGRGFSEGLSGVMIDGRCGYIDSSGSLRIPARFDKAARFRHERAWVCMKMRCGYIDKAGSIVWMATWE